MHVFEKRRGILFVSTWFSWLFWPVSKVTKLFYILTGWFSEIVRILWTSPPRRMFDDRCDLNWYWFMMLLAPLSPLISVILFRLKNHRFEILRCGKDCCWVTSFKFSKSSCTESSTSWFSKLTWQRSLLFSLILILPMVTSCASLWSNSMFTLWGAVTWGVAV